MRRITMPLLSMAVFMMFGGVAVGQGTAVRTAQGKESASSPFRVVRSVSGASGHEDNGQFVMDDARSVFTAGKDSKVIVYFEWNGPAGPHHFEGLWKGPEGKIVLISDFRYEAKGPEFSGYWTMLLSSGTPSGEWQLEARIDGEAAGTHTFVVVSSDTGTVPSASSRQFLSTPELYRTAMDATVLIEKLAQDGAVLDRNSGFWIGDRMVATAFEAIDGASALRVLPRDGSREMTDQVVAWSRWQDWAVLSVAGPKHGVLKRGPKQQQNVGDHCSFLEWGPAGAQLTDGTITGKNSFPRAGDRLLIASAASSESIGGALLDGYGEYVGIVGGAVEPGGQPLKMLNLLNGTLPQQGIEQIESQALAVPLHLFPDDFTSAKAATLADIAGRGEFIPPVARDTHLIGFATLSTVLEKTSGRTLLPRDYRQIFSQHDGKAVVYVNWSPGSRTKGICVLRFYNMDNKLLSESKPHKLSLTPGAFTSTNWEIQLASLPPSMYRVDLVFNGQILWREFFRVTE